MLRDSDTGLPAWQAVCLALCVSITIISIAIIVHAIALTIWPR